MQSLSKQFHDCHSNGKRDGNERINGSSNGKFPDLPRNPEKYFPKLPEIVNNYRGVISLKSPEGYCLRITDLDGTIYWGRDEMLDIWSELYLPEPQQMTVLGVIDNFPSLAEGLQMIVLVDEQGKVYFYENEVLHLVANSLHEFLKTGAQEPPIQKFLYGEYTAPESEEEYLKMLELAGIQRISQSTIDFVQSKDNDLSDLLEMLS